MLTVKDLAATRQMLFEIAADLRGSGSLSGLPARSADLASALGQILAEPVFARMDVPAFNRSLVDGYAVRAVDTFGASEALPAILRFAGEVKMGQAAGRPLEPKTCQAVPTGGQIPAGADAMIMIEDVDDFGDGLRYLNRAVSPGSYLVFRGDDIRAGEVLLEAGIRLEPRHLAAAAAAGLSHLPVLPKLRVAVLSTGDELVAPGEALGPGQVHDVNQVMLAAMIRQAGALPVPSGIIPDDFEKLQAALQQARSSCNVIVISGGSSVGARDHVADAIEAAGKPGILQHGIAVKPGKPTMIGLCGEVPVLGLPGHPVAAWFMAMQLLAPLLYWLQGLPLPEPATVQARLSQRIPSNHGREEFTPVRLDSPQVPGSLPEAVPIYAKSGLITLLSRCQGYICIPRDCEGLDEGSTVTVVLLDAAAAEGKVKQPWLI